MPLPLWAGDGVHLIYIKPQAEGFLLVREFIDNALLGDLVEERDGRFFLPASLSSGAGSAIPVSVLDCGPGPLLVFTNQHIDPLEERIANNRRLEQENELRREVERQVIGALFQVPIWPYLVASEVPMGRVDLERVYRLSDWRESFFPAATYAATGRVPEWDVTENTGRGIELEIIPGSAEGSGIVMEYILEGQIDELSFGVAGNALVAGLYIEDYESGWGITGLPSGEITSYELLGAIDDASALDFEDIQYSLDFVKEGGIVLSRVILSDFNVGNGERVWLSLSGSGEIPASEPDKGNTSLLLHVIAFWLLFGLLTVVGNYIYRFTNNPPAWLFLRSIAVFPLYLLVSLLTSGLWGMGFIPAMALISRYIADEGRLTGAFGVLIGVSFLLLFISLVIIF